MVTTNDEQHQEKKDDPPALLFGPIKLAASQVFCESRHSRGIVNLKPLVPGHVLVITKVVRKRFSNLSAEEVSDLWTLAQKVGNCVEQAYDGSSLTFAIQDGATAGQSVPHVHIHVLPRRAGDFKPPDKVYDELDAVEKEIGASASAAAAEDKDESHVKMDSDRKSRTSEEMAAEAQFLRDRFESIS